ncbi:MAG: hypothetical protein ACW99J_17945 [Candidatus Thorarchaeota archaeon]
MGGIVLAGAIELQADFATDILLKWVPDEAPPSSNSTTTTTTGPTDFTDDNDLSGLLLPIVGLAGLAVLVSLVVFAKNRNINVVSNITEEGHPIG